MLKYTDCEPMKATSNQNARPWTSPVCCISNASGIMMSWRSDSEAVVKSIVYFCDCAMQTRISNVSYKFQQNPSACSILLTTWIILKSQIHYYYYYCSTSVFFAAASRLIKRSLQKISVATFTAEYFPGLKCLLTKVTKAK